MFVDYFSTKITFYCIASN